MDSDDLDSLLWAAKSSMEAKEYKALAAAVARDMGSDLTPSGLAAREEGRSKWVERLEERYSAAGAAVFSEHGHAAVAAGSGGAGDGGSSSGDGSQKLQQLQDENDRLRLLLAKYESAPEDPAALAKGEL